MSDGLSAFDAYMDDLSSPVFFLLLNFRQSMARVCCTGGKKVLKLLVLLLQEHVLFTLCTELKLDLKAAFKKCFNY